LGNQLNFEWVHEIEDMREADSDVLQIQDEDDHFHEDYIPDAQNSIEASERMAIPDSGPPAEQKSP